MLDIRVIMNSAVEDVLAFKTCCSLKMFDQNLEIQVTNRGKRPVTVPSYFDLKSDDGVSRVETLIPHGEHTLPAGEIMAFYCYMDEMSWRKAHTIVMYDDQGTRYPVDISHDRE